MTSWVLKPGSHGTPPDDVGLDEGSSRREGTGLWGWLWGRGDFPLRRGVMFITLGFEDAGKFKGVLLRRVGTASRARDGDGLVGIDAGRAGVVQAINRGKLLATRILDRMDVALGSSGGQIEVKGQTWN